MTLLWATVVLPLVLAAAAALLPSARAVLALAVAGSLAEAALVALLAPAGLRGQVMAAGGHLFVDPLSTYHLLIVVAVFALSSIYAHGYFGPRVRDGKFDRATARRFGAACSRSWAAWCWCSPRTTLA
jgi:formate hydrogenlyase subunit 3/multisubunit Na+/H+ antiporter MnhD subunit